MTRDDISQRVHRTLVETLGCKPEEITDASTYESLGADSLDAVELTMEFEDQFGIEITDEEAEGFKTAGDAITFIESKVNG